ncbi:MAG: glycerophosphodiester phosphodiesterase family protein [Anaeromyxobacter sp.]
MPGSRLPLRPLIALAAGLLLGGCSKFDYLPDAPVEGWSPTVVLMHRGGGHDCGPGLSCMPNTLPAVLHGFETLDGAEVDIQITADKTLWLGHDNETLDCAGNQIGCFQDLSDAQIDAVAYCDGGQPCAAGSSETCIQHYVRVDEVFQAISGLQPEKLISLDIKGQYCRSIGVEEAKHMANEVDRLVRLHQLDGRVLAETSQLNFLDGVVDKRTPLYSFVVSLGDVDAPLGAAHERGATGISFKYAPGSERMDASVVAGIHGTGKRVILWTINEDQDLLDTWAAAPDVIETDRPDFFDVVGPP